jgi:hypothetical protein
VELFIFHFSYALCFIVTLLHAWMIIISFGYFSSIWVMPSSIWVGPSIDLIIKWTKALLTLLARVLVIGPPKLWIASLYLRLCPDQHVSLKYIFGANDYFNLV